MSEDKWQRFLIVVVVKGNNCVIILASVSIVGIDLSKGFRGLARNRGDGGKAGP